MKIISLINHKGGVGKTTLCTNLAYGLKHLDTPCNVAMVDADPQGSLRDWYDTGQAKFHEARVIIADKRRALRDTEETAINEFVQYLLIDTPGKMGDTLAEAVSMSDVIIIPLQPSPYDVWATTDTMELVRHAMRVNKGLVAAFLLNQTIPNSGVNKDVLEALHEYMPPFKKFKNTIGRRVAFNKSAREGKTVFSSKDDIAITEVENVTKELLGMITYEQL